MMIFLKKCSKNFLFWHIKAILYVEIFEKSGFSDKLQSGLCDWEENEPGYEQRVRRFSDKTGCAVAFCRNWRTSCGLGTRVFSDKSVCADVFCRNMQSVLCWELWDFPTKQVARECFVGKSWLFCAKTSRIFRQIRSPEGFLSEYAVGFVLRTRRFSDKTGRKGMLCRKELAVLC